MNTHTWLAAVAIVAVTAGGVSVAAAPTIGATGVSPAFVVVTVATPVVITAQITDPSLIPGGVNLLKTDASGRTLAIVGVMRDDGINGDAVAGDKTFSSRVTVNEPSVGPTYYRASAAFKGVLQRVLSGSIIVNVVPGTPPTITVALSPPPNANGWNNGPVTARFSCTPGGSPIAICPPDQVVATDGADQTVSGTTTDQVGHTASVTSARFSIDQTPPSISVALSPPANANGWNNSPVAAHFTCSDGGSGVATCPADQVFTSDVRSQIVNGTATDRAGNSASASAMFSIDQTKPTVAVTLTPPANSRGWHNGPVTAHFTCADTGAGIDVCPTDQVVASEGANQTVAGAATDKAGNSASVTSEAFSIDLGPPTITATLSPAPNENGWNNTPVIVHFTCRDAGSGIETCPADQTLSSDGRDQTATGTATDRAGNTASATSVPFSIDQGKPSITVAVTPAPNVNGFNNTPVTAHFTCADAGSGIAACPPDQIVTTDGLNQTVSGTATDRAGNGASVTSAPFSLDQTGPAITVRLSPAPNPNGWNNTAVTAHFTCTDSESGVATCPPDQIVTTDGADQTVNATATDKAGNATSVTSDPFSIDSSAPTITVALSPSANTNDWNNTAVMAHFSCADTGSGIAACPPDQIVAADGADQTVSGTATDNAGNTASVTSVAFSLDQTNPTVTVELTPAANANGWRSSAVTAHFTCSDAGSGVDSCPPDQVVESEGGSQTVSGAATDKAGNTASVTSDPFNIDLGAPIITVSLNPPPNENGWNNTLVTAHFTCSDTGSGIASCPSDQAISVDGVDQTATGTATDNAGNSSSVTSATFKIDQSLPTITVALSPVASGYHDSPVTAHFTCADTGSGIASCPTDQVITSEGSNQTVSGAAVDAAGNTASVTSEPFSIDLSEPTITVALTPAPNINGWNKSSVTAHFTCADSGSGVESCPPDQVITSEGTQTVTGTATDRAGHTAAASVTVRIDTTPPVFAFVSPANGATLFTPTVTATGTATDALSRIAGVTCNGAPATVSGTSVSCGVTLTPGPNSISATATDLAGNTSSATLNVTDVSVPTVRITSPANLSFFNISPTTVSGTVDDPTATVTINSVLAPVAGGSFSIALPLAEGPNIVTATATTAAGGVGTSSIEVNLDTTPPHVTITSPSDLFVTLEATISISGNINDIVVGTVNDQQAQVTVNGTAAQVANRTFLATDVPLAVGPNVIQAIGRDRVGNSATTQITVTRQAATQSHIRLISGNNQTGAIGSTLPQRLTVALTDASGNPVPNKPVVFKVTQNDGIVTSAGGPPAATSLATTDAEGHAKVQWTLGNRAGAGGNSLEAYAIGFDGTAVFTATGTQGPAGKIVVDTGNDQIGAIDQPLPKPLLAVVIDDGNNRLADVPVTFTVGGGGGSFGGEPTFTVNTDSDGRAAATLTLGLQEGNANNLVSANFPFNEGFPAAFTASGRAPGNPASTTISGVVLDNSNVPIPGVTIRAVLTNVLHSNVSSIESAVAIQTDARGQFSIAPAPVGFVKLLVDGSTALLPGTYPSLEYDMVTVAGQSNTIGSPIYILPLNTANQLCVTATTGGGTLTIPEAPGFSLTFGPGQVTFPGGSKTGCVSVTVVNGDKVPMVPGFGQQPRFIVTIQPSGAVFNPPAPITLPNVDGLKPREVTEMYSFDHDISSFVAVGTGTVSDDGLVIRSNAGVGVLKAGWHCGGNPSAIGKVADCGWCNLCVATATHPDGECQPANQPPPANPNDCLTQACDGNGHVVSSPDDTEVPIGPPPVCNLLRCSNGAPATVSDPSQNGIQLTPWTRVPQIIPPNATCSDLSGEVLSASPTTTCWEKTKEVDTGCIGDACFTCQCTWEARFDYKTSSCRYSAPFTADFCSNGAPAASTRNQLVVDSLTNFTPALGSGITSGPLGSLGCFCDPPRVTPGGVDVDVRLCPAPRF